MLPVTPSARTRASVLLRVLASWCAVAAVAAASLIVATPQAAWSMTGDAMPRPREDTSTQVTPIGADDAIFGVSTQGAPAGPELDQLISAVDRTPDEVMWFVAWGLRTGFPFQDARRVRDLGAVPVITWEPWNAALGADQTSITMRSIAAGRHDTYIRRWATAIRSFATPVVLRFAHEVNGTWYPWSPGVDGTTTRDAVSAWQRVHRVFARTGATNAVFRWSPNVPFPGSTPMADVWPGDSYVDQAALDGYNWAGWLPQTRWLTFSEVLEAGLDELGALTDLPVNAGETASPERTPDGTGDKAQWIRGMFDMLANDDRLTGFTWFNHDKELDWRIESSRTAVAAFRDGLARYH